MKKILLTISIILSFFSFSQDYTSYFTGSATNADVTALGGICLMGGASESDEAMTWFLNQANGGDILVLRASGSDGYNDYLYTDLGVTVNSVETIVFTMQQLQMKPISKTKLKMQKPFGLQVVTNGIIFLIGEILKLTV